MAEDETVIREVDQSIAEDRQAEFLKKRGPALLGSAAALVLAVAGWQVWKGQKTRAAEDASIAYWQAERSIEEEPETGEAAYKLIAEREAAGYAALAKFKLASVAISGGEVDTALAHFASIYNDTGASQRIKDLARLKAGYLTIERGRDETLEVVGSLENDESPLGDHAREIIALAALEAKEFETAETMFLAAAGSPNISAALRTRAEQFVALASAGKAGVALETKTGVEGFLDALDEKGSDLGAVFQSPSAVALPEDDHAGHDHGADHTDDHADEPAIENDTMEGDVAQEAIVEGDVEEEQPVEEVE